MEAQMGTLLISCLDRPGIIAGVSNLLYVNGCNIIDSDQHTDPTDGHFFWRIHFASMSHPIARMRSILAVELPKVLSSLSLRWQLYDSSQSERIAVMVSKLPHCMSDLLNRHHLGELNGEIVAVISNHPDLEPLVRPFQVPFIMIPVEKERKHEAEARLLGVLEELRCTLVVLARYMQVLSGDFLRAWGKPIINIHHSFLPAFVGAQPYKQAYERGVKLIGATAHYVTEELDAGPIITQGTTSVSHRDTVKDLARKGKDVEVIVLAQAVRAHLLKRVLVHGNKTIVFQ
jgi:formyltetrahydrofolate deformylase